jgi:hypothetical protein
MKPIAVFLLAFGLVLGGLSADASAAEKAPDFGSLEYLEALEVGALPPAFPEETDLRQVRSAAGFRTIEVGGESYRMYVDTP